MNDIMDDVYNRETSLQISDASRKVWTFENLREFYDFINNEITYWSDKLSYLDMKDPNKVHEFIKSSVFLKPIIDTINGWKNDIAKWTEDIFKQQIYQLTNKYLNHLATRWLWSGHPYISTFCECNKRHGDVAATAFIDFIINNSVTHGSNRNGFIGAILAYEFINQDSDITKRSISEKKSLDQLRDTLDSTKNTIRVEFDEFTRDLSNWKGEIKKDIDKWFESSQENFSEQQRDNKEEFVKNIRTCNSDIENLINTYREQIRLKEPANYWKKSARKYGIQGGLFFIALVLSIVLGVNLLQSLFSSWLEGDAIGLELKSLQGILIFATLLTVYAYLVRSISKLTFSSFHLMRDSEEREQLTYLYLSLINEKKIDETSRDIILQALFSRSETGLLSSDSSPTMPGLIDLLKNRNPKT